MQSDPLPVPEVVEITGVDLWKSELFGAVNSPAISGGHFAQHVPKYDGRNVAQLNSQSNFHQGRDCVVYDYDGAH